MHDHTIIHYPQGADLPSPWQSDWHVTPLTSLRCLPRRCVARAPAGTPIPDTCTAYAPPEPTADQLAAAHTEMAGMVDQVDGLMAEVIRGLLTDSDRLAAEVRAHLGSAHHLIHYAPISVMTQDAASRAWVRAGDMWDSRCSVAVIRAHERGGYAVWIGIGGRMGHIGRTDGYAGAEVLAVDASQDQRARTMAEVRDILTDWSDDTPYPLGGVATLATAARDLPMTISRGPVSRDDLPGPYGTGASSWDLPTVAVWRDGHIAERHDDLVTWDDDTCRERALARSRDGERRARDLRRLAVQNIIAHAPHLAHLDLGDRLAQAAISVPRGQVDILGPVRMREDGAVGLALVEGAGRKYWMALGTFA